MSTATHSGMTQDAINELIVKRVGEALKAYDTAKNPRTETEMENEQQDDNVEANVNNGNGNGNGNGNPMTVRVDAPYAMMWKALMGLMTEGNDLTAYNQRFQELTLLCTNMVPEEEDQVEKYIRGLPDNIQGNVTAAEPTRL
ncbi:hypothetical protein Tco_0237992 [Tanacetum coccineum]